MTVSPRSWVAVLVLAVAAGCGGGGTTHSGLIPDGSTSVKRSSDVIKHIVVIVQENRSFDNLFQGYPGADTVASGLASDGSSVPLRPVSMAYGLDPNHLYADFTASSDSGKMDGFDHVGAFPRNETNIAYAYVPRSEAQPYFDLASKYALADRMFASSSSASYTAHQYIVAGQAANVVNVPSALPWGCDAPAGTWVQMMQADGTIASSSNPPCFDYQTIADRMDPAGVTWAYYAPQIGAPGDLAGSLWTPFDAIRHIRYGADWTNNQVAPETTILTDIANGTLRDVSFVTPDAFNSDHARFPSTSGPAWVTSIVDAIGSSKYWKDTAIFVTWDDWGGWYDHVAPPKIDRNGPGFRVPLLVVSPYTKHGYVSHVQYETASITRYIENTFGLGTLGQRDAGANSPDDMFDYNQPVTPLSGIRLTRSVLRAASQRAPSHLVPDDD
jgi:phospholipase C